MPLGAKGDLRVFGRVQLPGLGSCLEDKIILEIKVEIHETWYFLILASSSRCLMHLLLQLTSTFLCQAVQRLSKPGYETFVIRWESNKIIELGNGTVGIRK